jgi:hypothetical protein
MYDILKNGSAELLSINLSPEVDDGPRNVYPSADGKWLYVVRICWFPHPLTIALNISANILQINEHCKYLTIRM